MLRLGFCVTTKNDVSMDIKYRIILTNTFYCGRIGNWGIELYPMSLMPYKSLILPALLYKTETWRILRSDTVALEVFGKKIRSTIFDPVRRRDLYDLFIEVDVIHRITIQLLRWHDHVVRAKEYVPARRIFNVKIRGPNSGN